jgi:Tol biopolymer transport system component
MWADGTHKQALTPYVHGPNNEHIDFFPSVAPDGNRIAFTRFASDGVISRIFVMTVDGGDPHAISPARLEAFAPDWSPSGRRITFSSNSLRAGESVFTMKRDGSDIRRITRDRFPHSDAVPAYSPQGDRIVFSSDRNYSDACCLDLFAINPTGGGEHLIDTGLSGAGILDPAWGTAPLAP